jgi:hypothetical protein
MPDSMRNPFGPSGMTRSQTAKYHGRHHVMLAPNHEGQTRRYHGYLKKKKAYDKLHGKTGGRRRRGSRYTRRR